MTLLIACGALCAAQDSLVIPEPRVVPLEDLVNEALARNPLILTSLEQISIAHALERQSGVFDPPELLYRRKEMPDAGPAGLNSSEWELMQMVKFPTKYGIENRIGEIQSEHSHHESQETVNEVLLELRTMYAELWYVQQRAVLVQEDLRIAERLKDIATSRYTVGKGSQSEIFMAEMLRTTALNTVIDLRREELGLKARLSALLARQPEDTLGYAVVSEDPAFDLPLDTVLAMARATRPMLIHDSLSVSEQEEMLASARQGYLPDLRLGISYMDSEDPMFRGWGVTAGITLPFAPWSIGKSGGAIEEAQHRVLKAGESFASTRNMVFADTRTAWLDVTGKLQQLRNIGSSMLPAAEQALRSSLTLYRDGGIDYPMVHQAYTSFLGAQTEYFMTRMQFEQSLAKLRFATGYNGEFQ